MVLKKIGVTSSGPFALILTNTPVKRLEEELCKILCVLQYTFEVRIIFCVNYHKTMAYCYKEYKKIKI